MTPPRNDAGPRPPEPELELLLARAAEAGTRRAQTDVGRGGKDAFEVGLLGREGASARQHAGDHHQTLGPHPGGMGRVRRSRRGVLGAGADHDGQPGAD